MADTSPAWFRVLQHFIWLSVECSCHCWLSYKHFISDCFLIALVWERMYLWCTVASMRAELVWTHCVKSSITTSSCALKVGLFSPVNYLKDGIQQQQHALSLMYCKALGYIMFASKLHQKSFLTPDSVATSTEGQIPLRRLLIQVAVNHNSEFSHSYLGIICHFV